MGKSRSRRARSLFGALALLLLIAAMLPLSAFLAGFLSGGGRLEAPAAEVAPAAPPGTLEITVVAADTGAPVEGARLEVVHPAGGRAAYTTDARGVASVTGLGRGPLRIDAAAGEQRATAWVEPAVRDRIRVSVAPRPRRTGHVRRPDGTPVQARVVLLGEADEPLAETQTDAEGRYVLPDVDGARAVCAIPADGAPSLAARGDVVLAEGERVEGRIEGARGGELEVFVRLDVPQGDLDVPARFTWPVGEDGSFAGRLPTGVTAWARYDGLPVALGAEVVLLPARAAFHGAVRRADGTPAPRAQLLLHPLLDADFSTPLPSLRVDADAEGRFDVAAVPQVRYAVEVRAAGCATRVFPAVTPAGAPHEFTLAPGFVLRGIVVDSGGRPLAGARLQAIGFPTEHGENPIARDRTDELGRFHLAGLGGTFARLRVTAPGHYPTTIERVAPEADLRVVLQPR